MLDLVSQEGIRNDKYHIIWLDDLRGLPLRAYVLRSMYSTYLPRLSAIARVRTLDNRLVERLRRGKKLRNS